MMFTVKKKEGAHDMKRAKLLELEIPGVTDEILELAKNDGPKKKEEYGGIQERYQRGIYFRAKIEAGILIVSFFFTHEICAGRKLPAYILFIDKEADEFITLETGSKKWRNSMLCNLTWPKYMYSSKHFISIEDQAVLKGYLQCRKGDFHDLQRYQHEVRMHQLILRDKKVTDAWDKMMEQVPDLPKDWEHWVARNGIPQHFMFYEYKRNGVKEGYCSHCRSMVTIKKPQYNKGGFCSRCGHPIVYKSIGKFGRIWTKTYTVYLLQKCKFGVLIREFNVSSVYVKEKYKKPQTIWKEVRRSFVDSSWNKRSFYYGLYKQREYRWIAAVEYDSMNTWNILSYEGRVYRRTLPSLGKKELCHTGLPEMIRWRNWIDPEHYLFRLVRQPVLEQVVKSGLFHLAKDLLQQRESFTESSKLTKALGIDHYRLQRLRKNQGGLLYLKWLQYEKNSGKCLSEEDLKWFVKEKFTAEDFAFIEDRMSPKQIKNYLIKQKKYSGEDFRQVLQTWKDYLSMAERMQMDTKDEIIYRTSRLYQRHKKMIQLMEEKDMQLQVQEILTKNKEIPQVLAEEKEKYEYQEEEYAVVFPRTVEEILTEGTALHHCIDKSSRYFERIAKRESFIVFLRKTENIEEPYYTLEVEPGGSIRQKRTLYNRKNSDITKAEEFLWRWQGIVRRRMSKQDWSLAKKSKNLRVQEINELREKKVVVHGEGFSGKLLADLLEEDMMEQKCRLAV